MKSVSDVYISLFGVLIKLTVKQCPFNILSVLNAYIVTAAFVASHFYGLILIVLF